MENIINNIRKYIYKIQEYFYYKAPVFVTLNIFRPILTYIQACWIFKRPRLVVKKITEDFCDTNYFYVQKDMPSDNKVLYINSFDVIYKPKYSEYVFETVPHIVIMWKWNNIIHKYVIGFESPMYIQNKIKVSGEYELYYERDNHMYWEAILEYVHTDMSLSELYDNNIGKCSNGLIYDIMPFVHDFTKNYIVKYIKDKYGIRR